MIFSKELTIFLRSCMAGLSLMPLLPTHYLFLGVRDVYDAA